MDREEQMRKLVKEINARVKKLYKLDYTVSDCYSTITVFDELDTSNQPEGEHVAIIVNY